MLDSLNKGWGIFHHVGHGFRNSMSVGDAAITNPDADALNNGNRTWLLYSINCTSNAIDFASLGEAFCLNPHGGAVANVGSTREDFPVTGRAYQDEFYDLVFQKKAHTLGQAFSQQKVPFTGLAYYDNTHRWTQFTLTLLGDPELPVWWRKPKTLTVTYPPTVPLSDTTFTVHVTDAGSPVDSARVCMLKTGEEYEVVLTNASGDAVMHVRPETAGAAFLTVTGTNGGGYRPFEGTVTFGAASGPVLRLARGRPHDRRRQRRRHVRRERRRRRCRRDHRLAPADQERRRRLGHGSVTATLSTLDARATITVNASSYGSIGAGATSNGTPYRVDARRGHPRRHRDPVPARHLLGRRALGRRLPPAGQGADRWRTSRTRSPTTAANGTIGNGNGRLDVGETVDFAITVRNVTLGTATQPDGHALDQLARASRSRARTRRSARSRPARARPARRSASSARRARTRRSSLTISDVTGVRYQRTIDLLAAGGGRRPRRHGRREHRSRWCGRRP